MSRFFGIAKTRRALSEIPTGLASDDRDRLHDLERQRRECASTARYEEAAKLHKEKKDIVKERRKAQEEAELVRQKGEKERLLESFDFMRSSLADEWDDKIGSAEAHWDSRHSRLENVHKYQLDTFSVVPPKGRFSTKVRNCKLVERGLAKSLDVVDYHVPGLLRKRRIALEAEETARLKSKEVSFIRRRKAALMKRQKQEMFNFLVRRKKRLFFLGRKRERAETLLKKRFRNLMCDMEHSHRLEFTKHRDVRVKKDTETTDGLFRRPLSHRRRSMGSKSLPTPADGQHRPRKRRRDSLGGESPRRAVSTTSSSLKIRSSGKGAQKGDWIGERLGDPGAGAAFPQTVVFRRNSRPRSFAALFASLPLKTHDETEADYHEVVPQQQHQRRRRSKRSLYRHSRHRPKSTSFGTTLWNKTVRGSLEASAAIFSPPDESSSRNRPSTAPVRVSSSMSLPTILGRRRRRPRTSHGSSEQPTMIRSMMMMSPRTAAFRVASSGLLRRCASSKSKRNSGNSGLKSRYYSDRKVKRMEVVVACEDDPEDDPEEEVLVFSRKSEKS